jgi:hypothetical protein
MRCFRKNEYHSGCKESCEAVDESGEEWDCEGLGGFRDVRELAPAPEGAPTMGTSLFCFAGVLPGSAEEELIGTQRERGLGIFACEDSAQYATDYTDKGEWESVMNSDVFIRVWERVHADGQYAMHDWVVKVDPDTVFHPQRLRDHLAALRAPAGASVYVKNTGFKFGLQGSLEVLSKQALDDYIDGSNGCASSIGHEGGEDFYLVQCLDGLGVAHMLDDSMLDDKYTYDHDYDMGDLSFCGSGVAAAYHPVKDAWAWTECHDMGR